MYRRIPSSFLDEELDLTKKKLNEKNAELAKELTSDNFRDDFNAKFDKELHKQEIRYKQRWFAAVFMQACLAKSSVFSPILLVQAWKMAKPEIEEHDLDLSEVYGDYDDVSN